ncbi:Fic family protein [Knoellia koreensis]|uniref:Fic family protein n=1 Tax=Knoellia koreensis TaxID=2730921 RepID=A0A849HED5_9MICO|nr:Fic family protein [Knoellia sp. DB2414S]NNM48106.1 Fic family protein [Knoellia sp. DB2414S]
MAAQGATDSTPDLAVRWEDHIWRSSRTAVALSRTQRATIGKSYRAAVPAQLQAVTIAIDPAIAAEADDARAHITRFDAELAGLFPEEFAPLSSVLLRTESASSSQIEHITTGARALSLAEIGLAKHGSNASLVAANVDAMNRALALADDVTPDTILAIHEALMRGQDHADPGSFRHQQVWIGGTSHSPHQAAFIPPHHDRVRAAVDDLCRFTERTDLPLLPQIAIAHAQFETIHPFNDGNGRTGRALVHAMLKSAGATTRTTVPVSAGLLAATDSYFRALTAFRDGNPNPIVAEFSRASFTAIENGTRLATDLRAVYDGWCAAVTARRDAVVWRVLPFLLRQPSVTSSVIQKHTGISQPAADNALRQLHDAGVLSKPRTVEGKDRKRNVVWQANEVLHALDAFAHRARRGHP